MGGGLTLPVTDQSGRPILLFDRRGLDIENIDCIMRAFWYQLMAAVEDDTSQRKGVCTIMNFMVGNPTTMSIKKTTELMMRSGYLFSHCLPIRFSSIHFCYADSRWEFFIQTVRLAISQAHRLRLRTHLGSDLENEYSLLPFGIVSGSVLQRIGKGDFALHNEYIQRRIEIDRKHDQGDLEAAKSGVIAIPGPSDVLIGRGQPYREFPGNAPWLQLISDNVDRHQDSGSRFEKTCISLDVVNSIRASKVRFLLERTAKGWKILDDVAAREKAAVALQNRAKSLARMEVPVVGNGFGRHSASPDPIAAPTGLPPFFSVTNPYATNLPPQGMSYP